MNWFNLLQTLTSRYGEPYRLVFDGISVFNIGHYRPPANYSLHNDKLLYGRLDDAFTKIYRKLRWNGILESL